ncbi:hypothetical protein METUNv1_03094 [Methyloversatilis universalis FAM5]|uniref:Uncharacterized protein n=1 Tax=Methyloversatilis universalis (strain ATCC BAA-1314 / DSM 25237 / JCM 13912 / CCUG 52030 / FAM5) TaxID=1000565 RepID=F5RFL3_METUF|nr:hypothetical protein METUNv1_03094 [Methyloversatilis universalis FAM5]
MAGKWSRVSPSLVTSLATSTRLWQQIGIRNTRRSVVKNPTPLIIIMDVRGISSPILLPKPAHLMLGIPPQLAKLRSPAQRSAFNPSFRPASIGHLCSRLPEVLILTIKT